MTVQARPSARCRRLLLELSRYLDDDLPPARRRQVARHVGTCECCATMAARLRRTIAACRAEGDRRPPRAVMSRAAARIRALIAAGHPRVAHARGTTTARP
jgi:anti-sigma factor RsiW